MVGLPPGAGGVARQGLGLTTSVAAPLPAPGSNPPLQELTATYYTDPLCSWSWALEAPWRRLRYELREALVCHTQMGGLIPDWQSYRDPLNSINRPAQMAPLWYQVGDITGMPIETRLWLDDPPASSYPACIAVKAAQLQGERAGERYLRRLREVALLEGRNIARQEVLLAAAADVAVERTGGDVLDLTRFQADLDGPRALDCFREDIKDARYRDIGRFPTMILRHAAGPAVIVVGYRPYQALREALGRLRPDLPPGQPIKDIPAFIAFWGSATAQEVAEAAGMTTAAAERVLTAAVDEGTLTAGPQSSPPHQRIYRPSR